MRRGRLVGLAISIAVVLVAGVVAAVVDDRPDGDVSRPTDLVDALARPLREQVMWVLAYVNSGSGVDELGERFAASFLRAVSVEELDELTRTQIRPLGPFHVSEIEERTTTSASLLVESSVGAVRMQITIEPEPPHRILGLLFQPVQPTPAAPLAGWDDLETRLRRDASDVAVLAAEIVDGECRPIHGLDADRVMPLGSAFKLYVLGALATQIAAGRASWDEQVTITDEHRVHTSMHLGTRPTGSTLSLREAATSMIEVSDNTATDLVMARVGRDAIESALAPMGMADPSATLPFLTTAEITRLKFVGDAEGWREYAGATVERRREILASLPAAAVTDEAVLASFPTGPVAVDTIEWFASAADLCRAHAALRSMGPEVRTALTRNPGQGLGFDTDRWPEIAFKGGSEPGVLAGSWSMRRDDDRVFSLVVLLMDTERQVPTTAMLDVAAAFGLLADID